ncbi:MAG: Oxygen regulatory protein NreC [Bacteroidetes bacterium ADurb.Bin217]|nr:MAG: Oxygen regulatory protein NreC [Bacteroidetes bacterium ADurb.Bin217]
MIKITVIIVDDHKIVRDGIKALISEDSTIEIIGEASSGEEFWKLLQIAIPHVVLMDINLTDTTGIELTQKAIESYPDLNILILSMHMSDEFITNSIEAGAKGYLPKTTSQQELLDAIKKVSTGSEYYNTEVSEVLLKSFIRKTKNASKEKEEPQVQLTKRELEIIVLFAEGLSNKEIADKLFISIRTVESHKNNIMQKLDLKSTVELVKYAIRHKMIDI